MSGLKASVNYRRVSTKIVGILLSHSTENLVRGPFLYFWKSQLFVKVSVAAHLSDAKILVNHRVGYHKE